MKKKKNRTNKQRGTHTLLLVLFCFALSAQNGTQYPLNDPRNPNCPCHKYMQQAEQEYKNLMANASRPVNLGNINKEEKEYNIRNILRPNKVNEGGISNADKEKQVQQRVVRNSRRDQMNIVSNINDINTDNNPMEQGVSSFEKEQIQFMQNVEINSIPVQQFNFSDQGVSSGNSSFVSRGRSTGGSFHSSSHREHTKWKHKRKKCHFVKWKKFWERKGQDWVKEFRHVARCYHWS